jgi:hypothetical protein
MADPVWVVDTSSIIEIRRSVPNAQRRHLFSRLTALVAEGRLKFPKQVVEELRRAARPDAPDPLLEWAEKEESDACSTELPYSKVKEVIGRVPDVLDPDKDSGADEADPYVLALAAAIREQGLDARIVTQETKDSPRKTSLNTAAGVLGIPSVPLRGLLHAEGIR